MASNLGLYDPSADIGPESSGERARRKARAEEIERENRLGGELTTHYERGCAAIAAARSVDEVREILDINAAMRAYAKQAKNRDLEADAVEIRLRAIRRLDQLRQAQAATVGLATGGEHGGRPRIDGSRANPAICRATLADQGIDKRLAHQGRVLGKLSDAEFEKKITEARAVTGRIVRKVVGATIVNAAAELEHEPAGLGTEFVTLRTHLGEEVRYRLPRGKATFNRTNDQISWAAWSWNIVTGCLHKCLYCYAREISENPNRAEFFPVGFTPLFHHERLDAPTNTKVPEEAASDPRLRRVFVCSMADLYGKWVPDEWIQQVHASCIANPQWDYLFLTKFPRRYVGLELPPTAWIGTSVDEQKRVRLAEEAFRQIKNVRVKWLSLEPLLAPLEFTDLSMFDWIVIGAQSATEQRGIGHVAEFAPPFEWVARLVAQAREAGCRVYLKPNLLGIPNPQSPGMRLIQEEPRARAADGEMPAILPNGNGSDHEPDGADDLAIPTFLRRSAS